MSVLEFIQQPWPWYVVGPLIALTMFLLLWFGREFGMSATLRTMCAASGGGKYSDFFKFDWKSQKWNLVFALGTILGGTISTLFLEPDTSVNLAESTVQSLQEMGIENPGESYLPMEMFGPEAFDLTGIIYLFIGGILIGFGARYAGGCTSGHAISGLSNLQLPSLIAVIGFFIGGLAMTYFILPYILPF
ncbi:MAG: YeeE/YedE family protein [Crocinitomicaceae bacterium]|nr:YeeE/YedE family protein [Crocinitomicaceae bacterium]